MMRKLVALLLVLGICLPLVLAMPINTTLSTPVASSTLTISTTEEFLEFALQCRFDGYSAGLSVSLGADIDLTDTDFSGIPVFLGNFNGRGYTITYSAIQNRDEQGLFLRLEQGSSVTNLLVEGALSADHSILGGVVVENYGSLNNIHFDGSLFGDTTLGGICAINHGSIYYSTVRGEIIGKGRVGGIVGENHGTIYSCTNRSTINHDISEVTFSTQERLTLYPWENEEISDFEDLGGIAGVSYGLIQSSANYGAIGYPETGYNVGGIVGRQSGYINRCTNHGAVSGRQSVGGVVGAITPYLASIYSITLLEELRQEMDYLSTLTSNFNASARDANSEIYLQSSLLLDRVDDSRNYAEGFFDNAQVLLDQNVDELNRISVTLADSLDQLVPILEWTNEAGDELGYALEDLSDLSRVLQDISQELEGVDDAFDDLSGDMALADADLSLALSSLSSAIGHLASAGDAVDQAAFGSAVEDLSGHLADLADELINNPVPDISDSLTSALVALNDALDAIDFVKLFNSLEAATDALQNMSSSLDRVREHLRDAGGAAGDMMDIIDRSNHLLQGGLADLESALEHAENSNAAFGNGMELFLDLVEGLSEEEEVIFTSTSPELETSKADLSQSFDDLSDQMNTLFSSVESRADHLLSEMELINLQFNVVLHLMIDILQEATTPVSDLTVIEDRSFEEIDSITAGKIYQSSNTALVEGISWVGGIAGSMESESLFDWKPATSSTTESVTQYGVSVVQDCRNSGKITGKRDNIGGIVGYQDFGLILTSEAQSDVTSTEGSYVGGIAGQSTSLIWDCFAKATLSGVRYIGGIVGYGYEVLRCYGLVSIESTEGFEGAIVGELDDSGVLLENYFVSDHLGGLGGVSYAGRAEGISYQQLLEVEGLPHGFSTMNIRFYVDDLLLTVESIPYGGNSETLPDPPNKEGYFAHWEDFSTENIRFDQTVTAQYYLLRSTLASDFLYHDLPLFLVDGIFTDEEILMVTSADQGYTLEVQGDFTEFHKVRYLSEGEEVSVSVLLGDIWHEVDSTVEGRYVVFDLPMEHTGALTLQLEVVSSQLSPILLLIGCVGLVTSVILLKKSKKT